jgi:hypothetical protein
MLYQYYKAIKSFVEPLSGVNSVEWFNNQYAGTIFNDKAVWVEFPQPVVIDDLTKDMERAMVKVRLHVVSRVLQKTDSAIPDAEIIIHEALSQSVLTVLRAQQLTNDSGTAITTKLRWAGWQHWHKYEGLMVTWIEFEFRTAAL